MAPQSADIRDVFAQVLTAPAVQSLARRVEPGTVLPCTGIHEAAHGFFAALVHQLLPNRPLVVVAPDPKSQECLEQDIATWLQPDKPEAEKIAQTSNPQPATCNLLFYPGWDVLPHEAGLPHADTIRDRLTTLMSLQAAPAGTAPVIVTHPAALMQQTFRPKTLAARTRTLKPGDKSDPLDLVEWLEAQGYEPEAQVTQPGEIALRGGILDVFPLTAAWPLRLEFFGDELESIRTFDPLTQISREPAPSAALPPAGEIGLIKTDFKIAQESGSIPKPATLLDYLPDQAVFLFTHPESIAIHAADYSRQLPPEEPFSKPWPDLLAEAESRGMARIELSEDGEPLLSSLDAFRPIADRPPEPQVAEAQRREFFEQIQRWLRQGHTVHVFCNNDGERQRFDEIWNDLARAQLGPSTLDARPSTFIGSLSRGFLCDPARLVVITDAEVFGRYRMQRPRRQKSAHAQFTRSALDIDFTELSEGDLVVHLHHGIGRYLGLKILPVGSSARGAEPAESGAGTECLVIEFASSQPDQPPPKLYVPVTEAHLVGKYVGAGKARPPLNTLGGNRWAKAKEHAERAVRDVAADLLAIQAARESQTGHSFPPDTPWQREFEGAFLFEETPDQQRAIDETKSDMERAKPMDRLICGDVGFGKTEVGIRAAFKSVMSGKQVAVLVPTTVLAQQHFNTFRDRMADYPVRIELLSRFRTRSEQARVVRDVAAGAVDIVIGTHRLLQPDIVFKDLGLVVIDEEQRFGVLHKERFKMLRRLVDVLTLSATPIPRTLYLALTGARDMSTIQTPPHDRLPVETIVTQHDERVIRDAIQRELARGGQVFFLHNRVMTIQNVASRLQQLVPNARIVIGHGQMPEHELEEVMTAFVNGKADVLLSTTIIESGLDIPNANTIIIDRADRFGLSDLYQLRGRVGRYKHQAYAYLLLPRHARLLTDVRKRIGAIRQFSQPGSGFKIAMRDLEIRGAGNLLGSEQSGHITAVGFELYCQLLKKSVATLKGETVKPRREVAVRFDFISTRPDLLGGSPTSAEQTEAAAAPAWLPQSYVPDARHRIDIYRKLAQAEDSAALKSLAHELRDRFGPPPGPVDLLLQLTEVKCLAGERGITAMEVKEDKLMLTRQGEFITLGGKFPRLTKKQPGARLKEIKRLLLAL
ncbi:MAG: transcription-repair coupling factor [Verrucomicrobiota bacterium]